MNDKLLNIIHGISSDHLVHYSDKILLTKKTLDAFKTMANAAKNEANLDLDIASGYRDFARQNIIYSEKFNGTRKVLDPNENILDISNFTPYQKIKAILYFSAIPGLSRHHFGTDIDIYAKNLLGSDNKLDLTNIEYSQGPQAPLTQWLNENLSKYGFFRPYSKSSKNFANELWHISFYEEANLYTEIITLDESINFIKNQNLLGSFELEQILTEEFEERFKIFG